MDEFYNKHYVTVDEQNRIINGFSDAFRQPSETDVCINEQGGYQFRLFSNGEENPQLFEFEHMIPLYAYENGAVRVRTQDEIDTDIAAIPEPEITPTAEERLFSLEEENSMLKAQINAQSEQMDFYEDCIAEMAMVVYA